jgi:hypothetical protein
VATKKCYSPLLTVLFLFCLVTGNAQELLNKMPIGTDTVFVVKWMDGWMLKNQVEWKDYVKENFYNPEDEKLIRFVVENIIYTYPNELGKWDVFRFDCGLPLTKNAKLSVGQITKDTFIFAKGRVLTKSERLKNQITIWNKDFPILNKKVYRSLDEALLEKSCVQILDLSGQKLTSIPKFINQFPHLKELYLNDNEIRQLPPELFDCQNLTTLQLNDNLLDIIPNEILNLEDLQNLDLGNNLLEDLPSNIFGLSHLVSLNLSKNPMSMYTFPEEIGLLKWLQKLNLNSLSIDCFPGVMTSLEFLEEVTVSESCFALKSRECSEVLGTLNFTKIPD